MRQGYRHNASNSNLTWRHEEGLKTIFTRPSLLHFLRSPSSYQQQTNCSCKMLWTGSGHINYFLAFKISTSQVPINLFVWALVILKIVTILSPDALLCFDFLQPVSQHWWRRQPGLQWTAKTTSTDTNHRGLNFKKSCLGNSNLIYLLLWEILLNWRKNFKPNYRL